MGRIVRGVNNVQEITFKYAIVEAKKSQYIYRLGAIAVKDNKIIARGHNKLCNHPFLKRKYGFYSLHAEANVILKAGYDKADTLIVVRVLKDGRLTCSFPCKKCQKMIKDFGYKRVIYTDWNGQIQELKIWVS